MHRNKKHVNKKKLIITVVAIVLTIIIAVAGIAFIVNYESCQEPDNQTGKPPISTQPPSQGGILPGGELPMDPLNN